MDEGGGSATDEDGEAAADGADGSAVDDAAARAMVADLRPDWTVEGIDRAEQGTDFVATIEATTPDGPRRAVLKATTAGLVDPAIAQAEPRLLDLVGERTGIPVPTVHDYRDTHDEYPAPFYLLEHVDGENFEDDPRALGTGARERVIETAGRHLAELHELGPLPAAGRIGVRDGELAVLDTDDYPQYDDFRDRLLAETEDTLDALTEGGFFPELAEDPDRFADLVPPAREYLRDAIPSLSEPDPPTYCHWDYRYGNLLVDPETGETTAVLDWANLTAADPAYNVAKVEAHLLDDAAANPATADDEAVAARQRTFREAYAAARDGWAFDDSVRERIECYRLVARLDAMACLPLWYEDATPPERDRVAEEHRSYVRSFL